MQGESLHDSPRLCDENVARAGEVAARLGVELRAPDDMEPATPDRSRLDVERARQNYDLAVGEEDERRACCSFPWHFLAVALDGSVTPCGWWSRDPPIGNLLRDDFPTLWQGAPLRRLRRDLAAGDLGPSCRLCPASGMGSAHHADSFAVRSHDWQSGADRQ
jgi:MoaA/NifB/PqqE/SkfB family radical SAM enzyme